MPILICADEHPFAEEAASLLSETQDDVVDVTSDFAQVLAFRDREEGLLILDLPATVSLLSVSPPNAGSRTFIIIICPESRKADALRLLHAGADACLTMPLSEGELSAHCCALLRRTKRSLSSVLRFGTLLLDLEEQTVVRNGGRIRLSPTEFRILQMLMLQPMKTVSKQRLTRGAPGGERELSINALDVHMCNLRRKLCGSGSHVGLETLPEGAYRLINVP